MTQIQSFVILRKHDMIPKLQPLTFSEQIIIVRVDFDPSITGID